MEFFIKEFKKPIKWNALGEVSEYESTYSICRTSVWFWFAKLFPNKNIDCLRIDRYNGGVGKILVSWWLYESQNPDSPKTIFTDKEVAENLLEDIQANPDRYLSENKSMQAKW